MRITQNFTDRKYLKNNNRVLSNYNKSMQKIWSQMDYFRASENAINASKAMTVRKNLQDLEMYDSNLKFTQGLYEAAEQNLYTIANSVYIEVSTKLNQACNGTYDQTQLDIIAHELDQYADAALTTLNADYAERRLFGGTNNSSPAFGVLKEADGVTDALDPVTGHKIVTYNGIPVEDISADGTHYKERITKEEFYTAFNAGDTDSVMRIAYDEGYDKEITEAEYNDILNGTGGNAADPEAVKMVSHLVTSEIDEEDYVAGDPAYSIEDGKYYKTETVTKYYEVGFRYYTKEPATEEDYINSNGDGSIIKEPDTYEIITEADYNAAKASNDPNFQYYKAEDDGTGNIVYSRPVDYKYFNVEANEVGGCKPIYVDIGLGIKYNAAGEVQVGTAVDVSMNGAKITGTGFTTIKNGVNSHFDSEDPFSKPSFDMQFSNNFVQLIYDAADALRAGDVSRANATIDLLDTSNTGILTEITTLGANQKSAEFYLEKDEEYKMSLQERQNDVEGCDMNEEIINMEATEAAYNALLQLSANILPKSIFDFI
ncbi:MAG: hypothetical protein ACI4SF_02370 [Oscillospiraceae bacterium]